MAEKQIGHHTDRSRTPKPEKIETLNFKVPADFKKAFKGYAVAQGITMVDLLREGFELSKSHRG